MGNDIWLAQSLCTSKCPPEVRPTIGILIIKASEALPKMSGSNNRKNSQHSMRTQPAAIVHTHCYSHTTSRILKAETKMTRLARIFWFTQKGIGLRIVAESAAPVGAPLRRRSAEMLRVAAFPGAKSDPLPSAELSMPAFAKPRPHSGLGNKKR